MHTFFVNYGWIIILFICAILYFVYVYKKKGKEEALLIARETAYKLMLAAQKKFGQDLGEEKFKWVTERFYAVLPKSAKVLVSEEDLSKYLQNLYNEFMDFLDDGKIDNSYKN